MLEYILDCALDALKDGALSIPILFLAYLFMELLERSRKLDESRLRNYSRKIGPLWGGLLGAIPQCGISGAAATLFSTGTITVGTMLAVFFATSDEMLPIMISSLFHEKIRLTEILLILFSKAFLGILLGFLTDWTVGRFFRSNKNIHSFCEREHCECDEGESSVWHSALHHTLKIAILLIVVGFALNLLLSSLEPEQVASSIFAVPVLRELLLALIGLIPNCSVSVFITEAYLSGMIGLSGLFSGLLANSGIGLLVLLRTNKNIKENLAVIGLLFGLSAIVGILIGCFFPTF